MEPIRTTTRRPRSRNQRRLADPPAPLWQRARAPSGRLVYVRVGSMHHHASDFGVSADGAIVDPAPPSQRYCTNVYYPGVPPDACGCCTELHVKADAVTLLLEFADDVRREPY